MPRGTSTATNGARRRRTTRTRSDAGSVVGQITQIVAANETLKRENAELLALNERLRAQLAEIGTALGSLTGGSRRRGRARAAAQSFVVADIKPKRTRRPITDPAQIERRRAALAKARAARAEKLAAAREGAATGQ